jgi:hypothetical protein
MQTPSAQFRPPPICPTLSGKLENPEISGTASWKSAPGPARPPFSCFSESQRDSILQPRVGATAPTLGHARKNARSPEGAKPSAGQIRIVAEVECRLSVVEELEAVVSANLQRATRLRQSILQKAFKTEN